MRRKIRKKVPVLCLCEEGHYKNAFKFFAENNMNFEVIWLNSWDYGSKFLLLCDVVSRIPEDVQYVLYKLKIDGEALKTNTMVVAMHRSECGQTETVYNRTGTPEDTLHSLALTNIYYNGDRTFDCLQNKNAKGGIESFLTE